MPHCSIIIPTYNAEATISKALDSILSQSVDDFEILIVDGLSSDKTIDIIRSYNDSRIDVVSEKDKGIYDAMNKGMDRAKGKWLFFLGSDDSFYDPFVLEKVFKEMPANDINVIYGSVKIVGDTPWAVDNSIYDGEFNTAKLLNKNICHQAIFYSTSFIRASVGHFNIDYRVCADWDFNLRCWARTRFHYIELIITHFTGGGTSTRDIGDEQFGKEYTGNILSYFNLSPFDKLVNNKKYWQFHHVLPFQKRANPIRYWINRIQKGIF